MVKGFIVYPTYSVEDNKSYVYLFGRLENGESFLVRNHYKPYFYIRKKDLNKVKKITKADFEDNKFKNFDDEPVIKLILSNPKDVPRIRNELLENNIPCYEADIRFAYRYLIDKDIKACIEIEGDYEETRTIDRVYKEAEIKPTEFKPKLKTLSIDIETDGTSKELYSISLYTKDFSKVLIKSNKKLKKAESFKDESSLLERFKDLIYEIDPDIITGWNVIDFDLNFLSNSFKKNKIEFKLGRIDWPSKLRLTKSFFIDSSADFPGRIVLDGIHLMKMSFIRLKDYKLNTAAKTILGKEKLLTSESQERFKEVEDLYKKNQQKLVDYNLLDAKLAYDIIKESKALDLTIKRSMLTRMQLDRVNASIASFDSLYLKELQKRKLVAPSVFVDNREERIKGGFVRESKPGIYDNILVLDFKSLYPSIIRTFNIDPYSYVKDPKKYKKSQLIQAPNKAYFRNEDGILSLLIQELWRQRDIAKKQKDELASYAIKILMNSMFGIMANPACRFYDINIANAITHFGQFFIKLTAEKVQKLKYEVIYGDTDSIFINPKQKNNKKAKEIGNKIQDHINKIYKKDIKKIYNRESFLELEFEKIYKKFLMPKVRGSETGAKKRYAGLIEKQGKEKIEITGLEAVRGDWTELAKKFQYELLDRIFHNKQITSFIKQFVKDLEKGKYDSLLAYRKSIRKEVGEYTKTTPPHIKAARKIGRTNVGLIEYYQTLDGPEVVDHRKHPIDYKHYIDKQIKPIADSILGFYNEKFEDLVGVKQTSLGDF
tara:strand:- start:52165 stop:54480 length:2316 start_codon:yes stop_codon:yes gene_type:complete